MKIIRVKNCNQCPHRTFVGNAPPRAQCIHPKLLESLGAMKLDSGFPTIPDFCPLEDAPLPAPKKWAGEE